MGKPSALVPKQDSEPLFGIVLLPEDDAQHPAKILDRALLFGRIALLEI